MIRHLQRDGRRTRSSSIGMRAALSLAIWFLPAAVGCGAGGTVEFRVETIAEGVRLFRPTDGGPNSTLVERGDGLLLIDAQPDVARARALLAAIRAASDAPVRYVVLSHPHREAAGGVAAFDGALVIATIAAADALADPSFDYDAELSRADNQHAEDERPRPTLLIRGEVELADTRLALRLVPLPGGHAPGELLVYMHDDSLIHAGGLAPADRNPYGGTANVTRWISTLNRLSRETPTTIIGTRGPALDLVALRRQRDALAWLRGQVQEAMLHGTPWERMAAEIAAKPEAAERFDTAVTPSFLEGLAAQVIEELRDQRRKRGLD